MYLVMTGWLLLASLVRVMIEVEADQIDALPFIGFALGLLALAGIAFSRVVDHDDERARRSAARRAVARAEATRAADPFD